MSDSNKKRFMRKLIHNICGHSKKFCISMGIVFFFLAPVEEFRHSVVYQLTMATYFLLFIFNITKDCKCDIMLDYTAGNKIKKISIAFFLSNFLVLIFSIVATSATSNMLPLSLIGIWFILVATTGLTEKVFETERLSELSKRSIQEITNLIDIQLMLGDLERADEASKILNKKAEIMSD